jgi:hypothetical protein
MPRKRGPGRGVGRTARLSLPALTTTEALQLLDLLDRLAAALWRTHGAALADRSAALGLPTPRPPGARWVGRRGPRPPDDAW